MIFQLNLISHMKQNSPIPSIMSFSLILVLRTRNARTYEIRECKVCSDGSGFINRSTKYTANFSHTATEQGTYRLGYIKDIHNQYGHTQCGTINTTQ